jgi:hypothetical protein
MRIPLVPSPPRELGCLKWKPTAEMRRNPTIAIDFSFSEEVISVVAMARFFGRRIYTRLFVIAREFREGDQPLGILSGRRVSRGMGKHRAFKAGELYFSMVCRIGEPQFRLVHMAGLAPFLRLIEITLQVDELLLDEAMRIPDCLIV